ncbi:MAG: hypothetical protein GY898_23240 [Proteobacteria bacterium]|nr:hypothetical protein [Pseudomonadota bacterium]
MALDWKGNEVKGKAYRAAILGIDATMAAAIIHAKGDHGPGAHSKRRFITRSSELERGTRIVQPARKIRTRVVGRWGVRGVVYARRIELGFQGKDSRGRVVDAPSYPYLRPAAEEEYPKLKRRVTRAFRHA